MSSQLVIRNAQVYTHGGLLRADLEISDGRISAITSGRHRPTADEVIDADGLTVLPGGIDTHVHLREPGFTHKEDITTGTMAAAAGGYTTCVGMPNVQPPTTTVERYRDVIKLYDAHALVDYNHNPSPTELDEIDGLAAAGAIGFKLYMVEDTATDYPHMPGLGMHHHGRLLDIAEAVGRTRRPLMVHAQDQDLVETLDKRSWDKGKYDYRSFARIWGSYDGMVWDSAVAFLLRLQEVVPFRLHVLHVRSRRVVELVRAAKAAGSGVTTETNTHCVLLCDSWDDIERLGPYALSYWNGPDTTEVLWDAMRDGTIDVLATDHAPHTRDEKEIGWENMWKAANGVPKIQETLSLFLTEVANGRLSLKQFVDLWATRPARVFGLYPKKGSISIGADADLAIVDLAARDTIRGADLHTKVGWTPWEGRAVQGLPIHTLVRGRLVMRDREVIGSPGYGEHARPLR